MEYDIKIKIEKQQEIGIALTCTPANRYNYGLYEQVGGSDIKKSTHMAQGATRTHGRFSINRKTQTPGRDACQQGKETVQTPQQAV